MNVTEALFAFDVWLGTLSRKDAKVARTAYEKAREKLKIREAIAIARGSVGGV